MKYLSIDIECADGGKGTICSFGYVIADENFNVLKKEDIIINPQGRFNLIDREGKKDVILAYPEEVFLKAPPFYRIYTKIRELLEKEEHYVIGHAIANDIGYLNKACRRYKLEPLTFGYFDTQRMYREFSENRNRVSLESAFLNLNCNEIITFHKSVDDAMATLCILKALLQKNKIEFKAYIAENNKCTGKTEKGNYSWDYIPSPEDKKRKKSSKIKEEKEPNTMCRGRKNHLLFLRYRDYGDPIGESNKRLLGKKVCISFNYEQSHFKEMIIILGLIKSCGGEYVLNAAEADVFATFEVAEKVCKRKETVENAVKEGTYIDIITLGKLLDILGTTIEKIEQMPVRDINYLLDEKYSKSKDEMDKKI